jgi:hypothetical protein
MPHKRYKPKIKPYLHQFSLVCIKKLVDCVEQFNTREITGEMNICEGQG